MKHKLTGSCSCCHETAELEHFDLLVYGSEGVWLCLECIKATCNAIQVRGSELMGKRRDAALLRNRERQAQAARLAKFDATLAEMKAGNYTEDVSE